MSPKLAVRLLLSLFLLNLTARAEGGLLVKDGQTIAFMGDSITQQGWEVPGGYVKLTVAGFETLGVKIVPIPAGIGGQTSREMVARIITDVIAKKPDWLTLSCGVNDVWHGAGGVDLENYKKNITSIVDQTQAAGIKVMILTATGIGEDPNNEANKKLAAYNDFLHQLAKERNLPLADENQAFQDAVKAAAVPGVKAVTHDDGVHPDSNGHQVLAKTLLAAFGATPDQLAKVEQAWQDMPASASVTSNVSLLVGGPITIRQFKALKAAADQNKVNVDDYCATIFFDAMLDVVKAHAFDPTPPTKSVIEPEMQKEFLAKIAALSKP
jgi:lysophospholipase L1-like esterase